MDKLGIKATLYDLIGYFIPGLLILFIAAGVLNQFGVFCLKYDKGIQFLICEKDKVFTIHWSVWVLATILSYFLGHLISSLSSLSYERLLIKNIPFLRRGHELSSLMSKGSSEIFKKGYSRLFKAEYTEKDFRNCICHVEHFRPVNHSTAFVFLSFYGMARNFSFAFFISFLLELSASLYLHSFKPLLISLIFLILTGVMFDEYYRFVRYFKNHIYSAFIGSMNDNDLKENATKKHLAQNVNE